MKISIDTNILIDDPKVVFDNSKEFVVSFTVIRELDKLKRNPDLKRAAQAAIKNIWYQYSLDKIEILNIPKRLDESPDEMIVSDTKGTGAALLSGDIGARIIAKAHGVPVSDFEAEGSIDVDYTGYVVVEGALNYESRFVQIKELQLEEFNEVFGTDLKENMYCIIDRMVDKSDIWVNQKGCVTRISQSMKPFKDAGVLITPMDSEQMCALHAVFDASVPLTVIDGVLGTGKTILALAGVLACVTGQKRFKSYDKIYVSKPPVSTNKDLYTGFKPGPQPLTAKVLTPTGWTTMGALKVGSMVMGSNGKPTQVVGVYPKGSKEIFEITTTTGKKTRACSDHLWATQNHNEFKHGKDPVVRTTAEIASTLTYKKTGKLSHHLPRRAPMEFGNSDTLPLDPYVLGCLLGDGSIGVNSTPTIISVDIEIVQAINDRLAVMFAGVLGCSGISYSLGAIDGRPNKPKGKNTTGRFTNPVKAALAELGLLGKHFDTKFIPSVYMFSSIDSRLDMLRGLMDTDGTVNRDGKAVFYTSGIPLMKSVIELVYSLGGSVSVYSRSRVGDAPRSLNGREVVSSCDCHEVSITLPEGMVPYLLPRKVSLFTSRKSIKRKINVTTDVISGVASCGYEPVQCIRVDSNEHLYVTDDYMVTHNTSTQKMNGHLGGLKSNLKFLLDKKGDKVRYDSEGNTVETKAGEVWSEYFDIIEIDEAQGVSLHDCVWIIDEWQLLDEDSAKMVMSRISEGGKLILVGDTAGQTYGMNRANEGFKPLFEWFGKDPAFSYVKLDKIYRSPLAEFVAKVYQ